MSLLIVLRAFSRASKSSMQINVTIIPDQGQASSHQFSEPTAAIMHIAKLLPAPQKRELDWRPVEIRTEQPAAVGSQIAANPDASVVIPKRGILGIFGRGQ